MALPPSPREDGRCAACGGFEPDRHEPDCPDQKAMADAVDSATGVAAPLLGGFTLTLIGLIVSGPEDFRWPGWTLLLLTLAVLLFVACVQAGFWARRRRPEPAAEVGPCRNSYGSGGPLTLRQPRRWQCRRCSCG
jgi:hypothetical protein